MKTILITIKHAVILTSLLILVSCNTGPVMPSASSLTKQRLDYRNPVGIHTYTGIEKWDIQIPDDETPGKFKLIESVKQKIVVTVDFDNSIVNFGDIDDTNRSGIKGFTNIAEDGFIGYRIWNPDRQIPVSFFDANKEKYKLTGVFQPDPLITGTTILKPPLSGKLSWNAEEIWIRYEDNNARSCRHCIQKDIRGSIELLRGEELTEIN